MATDDLGDRVAGIAALADPIRRELYLYVSGQPDPVSRDQACEALGIARHTAKFHLDRLADEGLLDTEFRRLFERRGPGAGRPTKLYARSGRQLTVTLPERRYDLAGELLAGAIDRAGAAKSAPVVDALTAVAAEWGQAVGMEASATAGSRPDREQLHSVTRQALAAYGYEPHGDNGTIELGNCPFDALAREHTELVCGMNLAIMTALSDRLGHGLVARLEPAPGRCCVVLEVKERDAQPVRHAAADDA